MTHNVVVHEALVSEIICQMPTLMPSRQALITTTTRRFHTDVTHVQRHDGITLWTATAEAVNSLTAENVTIAVTLKKCFLHTDVAWLQ